MMDDRTLEWLFLQQVDPSIDQSFQICVQYRRKDVSLAGWIAPPMSPFLTQIGLIAIFQSLTEVQRTLIKENESENIRMFLTEILPFAIMSQLGWIYQSSWKTTIKRLGNMTTMIPVQAEGERIDFEEVFTKNIHTTLLGKMAPNFSEWFPRGLTLSIPKGTTSELIVDEKLPFMSNARIRLVNPGSFDISVKLNPTIWSVGIAPGNPIGAALGGIDHINDLLELQDSFAYCCFDVNVTANFEFPDQPNDEFMDQFKWAQQLIDEMRLEWDWDKKVSSLPPGILYSIQRDVREILDLMHPPV
jgi:hypothetical protein